MKRDFNKILSEYANNGKGQTIDKSITASTLTDFIEFVEASNGDGREYTIKVCPSTLVWCAFKFGYVSGIRSQKRKTKNQNNFLKA